MRPSQAAQNAVDNPSTAQIGRREAIASALSLAAAASLAPTTLSAKDKKPAPASPARFSMHFAPHDGSFRSRGSILDQIAYAADQGFTAWEDNDAGRRPVAEQEAMARLMAQRGIRMGVFVASPPNWGASKPVLGANSDDDRTAFLAGIQNSVAVGKRMGATWATVVPGFVDPRVPMDIQTARVIDTMRRAADIMEPHGITMVMEPLNTLTDHPGVFLRTIAQGYAVARAVNRPSVKVLADLYHEQIQAGNLIRTLDACWGEIAYLQFGDNPGRNEPGSGEINYGTIVAWLKARGFDGVIGMEHGNSLSGPAGELRLIEAYRGIDRSINKGTTE